MRRILTWLRPVDRKWFGEIFAAFPGIILQDANPDAGQGPVDLETADGLLLTGGEDISIPYLRQPVPDPTVLEDSFPERDAWEFPALERSLQRGIPVLAICRGHQILNVALGGTLHLHIPGHDLPEQKTDETQQLVYEPDVPSTQLYEQVNSSHHQAIDRLGQGLRIDARCAADGIIEQVRGLHHRFLLGVQYHPERGAVYAPLFADFVRAVEG